MYVDIDRRRHVSLHDMNGEETRMLIDMIRNSQPDTVRRYAHVLRDLTEVPVDKLRGRSPGTTRDA